MKNMWTIVKNFFEIGAPASWGILWELCIKSTLLTLSSVKVTRCRCDWQKVIYINAFWRKKRIHDNVFIICIIRQWTICLLSIHSAHCGKQILRPKMKDVLGVKVNYKGEGIYINTNGIYLWLYRKSPSLISRVYRNIYSMMLVTKMNNYRQWIWQEQFPINVSSDVHFTRRQLFPYIPSPRKHINHACAWRTKFKPICFTRVLITFNGTNMFAYFQFLYGQGNRTTRQRSI